MKEETLISIIIALAAGLATIIFFIEFGAIQLILALCVGIIAIGAQRLKALDEHHKVDFAVPKDQDQR